MPRMAILTGYSTSAWFIGAATRNFRPMFSICSLELAGAPVDSMENGALGVPRELNIMVCAQKPTSGAREYPPMPPCTPAHGR